MDADACKKPASHSLPPPPALFRARSGRVADLTAGAGGAAFSGPPDTPPRRSLVTVPFIWEDAPGKPKPSPSPPTACCAVAAANAGGPVPDTGHADTACQHPDSGHADPRPLKLPPRLQQVPSFAAAPEYTPSTPSPKTVLQGPYHGCTGGGGRSKPPKWVRSGGAALRRTPSAGVALLSRTWSKRKAPAPVSGTSKDRGGDHDRDAAGPRPDAPWCSPASSSSASSVSTSLGRDDHGRGRNADAREASYSSEEDDGSPRASVRFTRFTRNRSLPTMTTSNLWASVRRSVKHITPIFHGARSWATTRWESSATQSGGSGTSRMVQRELPKSSFRLHLEEFPLGEETGLPLIPCPDCGLARVIERRLAKETTKNHLHVFFKCPFNVNGFPKLCGFYKFQREYLDKLKELGIVRIQTSPALEIVDEATEGGDVMSEYTKREMKMEAKKESNLDAKMEDLLWKFNLMFVFVGLLGGVFMYLAVAVK